MGRANLGYLTKLSLVLGFKVVKSVVYFPFVRQARCLSKGVKKKHNVSSGSKGFRVNVHGHRELLTPFKYSVKGSSQTSSGAERDHSSAKETGVRLMPRKSSSADTNLLVMPCKASLSIGYQSVG